MTDISLALSLTPTQLMLHHAGIRRWPDCPKKDKPCPGHQCLGTCPPLSDFHGEMPPYVRYSGTLQPWRPAQAKTDRQLLEELPTTEELDAALALIQQPIMKWRVWYIEASPHQIESTHATEAAAQKRQAQLGTKYMVKAEAVAAPAHPAADLLARVKAIVAQVGG